MITRKINNQAELVDVIGVGSSDPKDPGSTVVELSLWNGLIVTSSYYRAEESELDVVSPADVIYDDEKLQLFVEKLLNEGRPIVTETGSHDMVCTLKWEISKPVDLSEMTKMIMMERGRKP